MIKETSIECLFDKAKNLFPESQLYSLLNKYKNISEIPVTTNVDAKYGDYYCQIFRTERDGISKTDKESVIKDMMKEHFETIELVLESNQTSSIDKTNQNNYPLTYMPSISQLNQEHQTPEIGLIRMADDINGHRVFRLYREEHITDKGQIFWHLLLLSDLGITVTKDAKTN